MGNNISHKRTKAPKQAGREKLPDMDQAQGNQFFSHLKQKPNAKIVLLLPLDKRQQRAEAAAGPGVRPQRPNEDAMRVRAGLLASPMFRGAGDGPDRRERACRCPLKVQVLLLQLDAQRQQEGHRAEGGAGAGGGAAARGAGPRAAPGPQRLPCRQPTRNGADAERDPGEQRP